MTDVNQVHFVGTICDPPEFKVTTGGKSLLKLRVSMQSPGRQYPEKHWVTCWEDVAEAGKKALKGDRVDVTGELRTSSYEKDGVKIYKTDVVAQKLRVQPAATKSGPRVQEPEEEIPFR